MNTVTDAFVDLCLRLEITIELSAQDEHYLKEIFHLVLMLTLNGRVVGRTDLLSRESSPGVWDANEPLMLREIVSHFTLSVYGEIGTEERQLLASGEVYGPDLYDELGEPVKILLDGHEDYPNMILKTKLIAADPFDITQPLSAGKPSYFDRLVRRNSQVRSDSSAVSSSYGYGGFENPESINIIIQRQKLAANLTPDDHPEKPRRLSNLGSSLGARFQHLGNINDIDEAVSHLQTAVILTPDGHPDMPSRLYNLGTSFLARFQRLGNLDDIDNAILRLRAAVSLTPDVHPEKPSQLTNLGSSLRARFQRLGNVDDIDNAIAQHQAAVDLTPDGHPDKPELLSNLENSLHARFERLGGIDPVDHAIVQHQETVSHTPDDHPDKPRWLSSLGSSLQTRFQRLGNISDIDNAIERHQEAVNLTPDGYPDKVKRLNNLGNSFLIRFRRLGNLDDVDNAIAQYQAVVDLTPDGHPEKPSWLNNLGSSLRTRFQRFGNLDDLSSSIARHQAAVDLTPDSHPDKLKRLNNLGNSLLIRFQRLGNLDDITNAIARQQAAVDLTLDGHPSKPSLLSSLGSSLRTWFQRLGNLDDIDNSVAQHQAAFDLTPAGHPDKLKRLNNLGNSLLSRFQRLGNLDDINNAIAKQQMAVDLTPDGHPHKPSRLTNLGISLLTRFKQFGQSHDVEACIAQFSVAASSSIGPPSARLTAAKKWIHAALINNHTSLLAACECAITIIPLVAWLGLSIPDRHQHLAQIGGIVRDAAAIAISLGQCDKALEWLDHGRSIVWTQILQLRTPVDQLREFEPNLANRLLHISQSLDQGTQESNPRSQLKQSPEEEARQYRALAKEYDEIVDKVRSLPNFRDFLRPPTIYRLVETAKGGPVVVINVSDRRCDALALVYGVDGVIHIPLPDLTSERVAELQVELKVILKSSGIRLRALREEIEAGGDEECKRILAELWDNLVKPVLDSLAFISDPEILPRMWWCVTGPLAFLPIHAAGVYDTEDSGEKIQDYAIVSYVPTISALLEQPDAPEHNPFRHLSAIEPSSGASYIPNTEKEMEYIRRRLQNRDHVVLHKAEATKERVVNAMKDCNWLHLACHGKQNAKNPTKSALLLHGGDLTLEEIIRLNLPHAEFAFLSACQTMTGDEALPEEAVHIAGGMSLAGYRSVVATMWSIEDELAPKVADEFYAHLLQYGERPDNRKAAEALHFSVKKLREEGDIEMLSWVPFVHLGV
ncbi:hypothetical protein FRB91_011017 [Serendipita sp. 411]|nr:hypothetical protein FRB91_011017 [Serendipita sp. 411]